MAGRVLGIAAGVVIALLVGLWLTLDHDEPPSTPKNPIPQVAPTSPTPTPPRPLPPTTKGRTGSAAAIPGKDLRRRPKPQVTTETTPLPTAVEDAPRKPPSFGDLLAEQILATESLIVDCADKASKTGSKLTGETAVSFTLARRNDGKIVLEATGVEYSTITDRPTMDCLRDTAREINLDALPDGADAIVGYRKVLLKDGALVVNRMTEFAVVRPGRP